MKRCVIKNANLNISSIIGRKKYNPKKKGSEKNVKTKFQRGEGGNTRTRESIGKYERHNERKNEHYGNMNVDLSRTSMNVHFKSCGELTYNETLGKLVADGKVSLRGLKKDATKLKKAGLIESCHRTRKREI